MQWEYIVIYTVSSRCFYSLENNTLGMRKVYNKYSIYSKHSHYFFKI